MAGIVVNTASDMTLENGLSHTTSAEHIRGDLYAVLGAVLLGKSLKVLNVLSLRSKTHNPFLSRFGRCTV